MKKSSLKQLIKTIIKEISQKDIRSVHPRPAMPTKYNDQTKPDFKKMTLDNIKAIREKCKRTIEYLKVNKHLRTNIDDLQRELRLWKLCEEEIKRRLQYINKPVEEDMGYNNNVSIDNINTMERDPLTDPRLNKTINESRDDVNFAEWLDPNGKSYDMLDPKYGDDGMAHWEWADAYLNKLTKSKSYNAGRGDPVLKSMGWIRVVIAHWQGVHGVIYSDGKNNGRSMTRKQKEYLEDKSEESRSPILDSKGKVIYEPHSSKIQNENILKEEQYRFDDFTYLARGDGFGVPSDVYYGTILLGVIVSQDNGYLIGLIKGPTGDRSYRQDPKKPFKTKDDAAEALHRAWKSLRQSKETEN